MEGHGPRKEFFLLAGSDATADEGKRHELFSYNRTAGCYWLETYGGDPNARTQMRESKFQVLGWLMASSISNRSSLRLPLPSVLFKKLLDGTEFRPDLDMVRSFDPAASQSILKISELSNSDFSSLLELEDCDANMGREDYMEHAAKALLVDDISWQFAALSKGFYHSLR